MSGLTQGTRNVAMSALPRANAGRLSKSVVAERALGSRPRFGCPMNQTHPLWYIFCGFCGRLSPHFVWLSLSQFLLDPPSLPFFGSHNGHWAPHVVLQAGPHRAQRARRDTGAIHQATGEALGRRRRQGRAIRTCGRRGLLGELNELVGIYSHASILYTIYYTLLHYTILYIIIGIYIY